MEQNPLDNLPPETRQRVEDALRALGGGATPQNIVVTGYPGTTPPQGSGQSSQNASSLFGNVTFPGQNVTFPGESTLSPFGNVTFPGQNVTFPGQTPQSTPSPFGNVTFPGQAPQSTANSSGNEEFPPMRQILRARFEHEQKNRTGHDQAWAHWEYDPSEWAAFDRVDWFPVRNKAQRTLILSPILCVVIIGAILLVATTVFQASLDTASALMLGPAIILLTGLMFVMISAGNSGKEAKKRYLARQNQAEPHRVTFSSNGVWEAGTYFTFKLGLLELESVKLTTNPSVLHFKMLKLNADGSWTGTAEKLHVLVPRGHEAEAEQLRQRYYAEAIKTSKKPYNPPEPV